MPATDQSEQHGTNEDKRSQRSYYDHISKANFFEPEWQQDNALQERQKKILELLPKHSDLVEYLKKFYANHYQEEIKSAKKFGKEVHHLEPEKVIRGELFELLVMLENQVFDLNSNSRNERNPQKTEEHKQLENKFTDFIKHPDKYGFDHLWVMRKPDLSYVETRDENLLVLTGTGEAKSAKNLDYRSYKQLLPTGLRKTLERSIRSINDLSHQEATRRGLDGLGRGRKKLAMVINFTQFVIMCRDIDFSNIDYLINRSGFNNSIEYEEFKTMLRGEHSESKVKLIHSSFSEKELDAIFKAVMPEVKKTIAQ
ncbi:hypothetical protein A2572_04515 [Candidatus Collierbacteria bacterium RIFOXYD1_FULL_40_9]|uniref:Uncharacterized protein n=1 Tax=Candidatus Collierbacteria bacterium RIFOXYD1_FULL_40_9 TaxID=1817731 RepID=A0A1F5FPS3_9BACT|nr:MAG: hypothetical protein A2572_04515 [Candidatus Collierbacteria bacterium RIFOXYD1_FULL_40_9]